MCMAWGWDDRLKDDLSQCGCDAWSWRRTLNSVQACSILHVAHVCVRRGHCCHCPHWSWRCCCRHILLRSHFCSWFAVSWDVPFTCKDNTSEVHFRSVNLYKEFLHRSESEQVWCIDNKWIRHTERQAQQQHEEWPEACGNSRVHRPMTRRRCGLNHSWACLFL